MFDLAVALFPDIDAPRVQRVQDTPLQQSALYARAAQLVGAQTGQVILPEGSALAIHRSFSGLGRTALISRGLPEMTQRQASALRARAGCAHLIVNAEDPISADALRQAGFWRIARARQIAELSLMAQPDAMAARLSGKWRNRLRHAIAQGVRVDRVAMPPDPRHWLFDADAVNARLKGYAPMPPVMVAALAAAKPGAAQLFVARRGGGRLAAMLFVRHGRMATYQIGWSTQAGRACSAGNLLMWRAMLDLGALGIETLDLGLAGHGTDRGLTRFKCGTGARLRWLGGSFLSSAWLPPCPQILRRH